MKNIKLLLFAALFQCIGALAQNQKAIYVDIKNSEIGSGAFSDPYKTIKMAVDSAVSGGIF